jgi:hypothetical protein
MPFKKGEFKGVRRGGRTVGTPNKNTAALKDMILTALSDAGGVAYLAQQAVENPGPFLALVGKVLPLQVKQESVTTVETVVKLANLSDAELASMRSMLGKAGVQERADDRVLQ